MTLAFRAQDVPDALFDRSGFLVPPVERRTIKASTFSFAKWAWVRDLDPDVVVLRTSLGRHREEATLQAGDEGLVRVSLADLAAMAGITARPVDTHVQRWGGAPAAVRRRPPRPGRADPRRRRTGSRGSRSAGRRTTASASPR